MMMGSSVYLSVIDMNVLSSGLFIMVRTWKGEGVKKIFKIMGDRSLTLEISKITPVYNFWTFLKPDKI